MDNQLPPQNQQLERDAKKAEQASRDKAAARKAKLMPLLRLGGIVIAIAVVIGGLIWIGESQDNGVDQPSPISGGVTEIDHVKGPDTAKLTLVEYADFQCPTCAAYAPVLEQLVASYPDDLRIVYRYFPLQAIHPNATIASQAAEAAGIQGKFWEFHDMLFDRQADWNRLANPRDTFSNYANDLGLNVDQFRTDMDDKATKNRVNADYRSGLSAGVGGTPTFFLNNQPIDNPRGFEAFKAVIDAELE